MGRDLERAGREVGFSKGQPTLVEILPRRAIPARPEILATDHVEDTSERGAGQRFMLIRGQKKNRNKSIKEKKMAKIAILKPKLQRFKAS